jgi:CheY-like chemotaxis protein
LGLVIQGFEDVDSLNQVLLVDDNALQLSVREAVLRNAGFQVSIATSAESALAILRILRSRIGVIVTDHLMPGCSGPEFVRNIRAEGDWIPVIVLSGLPEATPSMTDSRSSSGQSPSRQLSSSNWCAQA